MPKESLKRSLYWTIVVYPESLKPNWKDILSKKMFKWVCSPLHDKDITNEGTLKKPHYHLIFAFDSLKSKEQIFEICKEIGANEYAEIVHSIKGAYEYTTHANNPEKAQYDKSDIQCFNGFNIEDFKSKEDILNDDFEALDEIISFIDEQGITEFSDFYTYCRTDKREWFKLVSVKFSFVINMHIKSKRHKAQGKRQ